MFIWQHGYEEFMWEKICKALSPGLHHSIKVSCSHYWSCSNLAYWFRSSLNLRLILQTPGGNFLAHIPGRKSSSTPHSDLEYIASWDLTSRTLHQMLSQTCHAAKTFLPQSMGLNKTPRWVFFQLSWLNLRFFPPWCLDLSFPASLTGLPEPPCSCSGVLPAYPRALHTCFCGVCFFLNVLFQSCKNQKYRNLHLTQSQITFVSVKWNYT